MASGTKNKNWVLASLEVDGSAVPVVDSSTNSKAKVCVDDANDTMRICVPGGIQFSNKDYEQSQGSRLATDMNMAKVPDRVLYQLSLLESISTIERHDKKLSMKNSATSMSFELASKWSLNDLI